MGGDPVRGQFAPGGIIATIGSVSSLRLLNQRAASCQPHLLSSSSSSRPRRPTSRRWTSVEYRRLEAAQRAAKYRDTFKIEVMSAARMDDLLPGLRQHQPAILHFAGHGEGYGELQFSDDEGKHAQGLWVEAFASLIKAYQDEAETPLRLAVLAGCHTAPAAHHLAAHVDCAIGFDTSIADDAIINFFTPTLYGAMFDGRSVGNAVDSARSVLEAHDQGYVAQAMQVYVRKGVDASTLKPVAWAQTGGRAPDLHLRYLQRLFEGKWASVAMNLFDPALGKRVDLLDIYTPLPLDFTLSLRLNDRGEVEDWWCGREALPGEEELAEVDTRRPRLCSRRRGSADAPEEAMRLQKQRNWASLLVDEAGLRPLLAQAEAWAGAQPAPGEGKVRTEAWTPDAEQAALVQPHFVLVGDPGSGKSTFLRHLALCWAGALRRQTGNPHPPAASLDRLPGWARAYTPIYLELRPLVESFDPLPSHPDHAPALPGLAELRAHLRKQLPETEGEALMAWLFDLLREGRAALLLDGLDEVSQAADPRRRAQVQAFVASLTAAFPAAPIIVTARPYAYRQGEWALEGFGRAALAPLPRDAAGATGPALVRPACAGGGRSMPSWRRWCVFPTICAATPCC